MDMLRRIEPEESTAAAAAAAGGARASEPVVPAATQDDLESTSLPHDHPRWVRDAIAVSHRARRLLEKLKPVLIAVVTLWDHRWRGAVIAGRRIRIDASGSYRADV